MRMLQHPPGDALTLGILNYNREDIQMKIKNTITEADLDFCYDILIFTVTAMLIMAIVWKVIA